jgi:hypothetical protein
VGKSCIGIVKNVLIAEQNSSMQVKKYKPKNLNNTECKQKGGLGGYIFTGFLLKPVFDSAEKL